MTETQTETLRQPLSSPGMYADCTMYDDFCSFRAAAVQIRAGCGPVIELMVSPTDAEIFQARESGSASRFGVRLPHGVSTRFRRLERVSKGSADVAKGCQPCCGCLPRYERV
jgi:hypothetical protein